MTSVQALCFDLDDTLRDATFADSFSSDADDACAVFLVDAEVPNWAVNREFAGSGEERTDSSCRDSRDR